jgi:hypoxanthine phosphoribosyltransferase
MPFNAEEEARDAQAEPRARVFPRRVRDVRERYEVDTRSTIEKALRNLMELAEEAHRLATSKYQPTEDRQRWARIEAYIYQTINSLAKTRDSQTIEERLEELTRNVDKLMEEGQESREEG